MTSASFEMELRLRRVQRCPGCCFFDMEWLCKWIKAVLHNRLQHLSRRLKSRWICSFCRPEIHQTTKSPENHYKPLLSTHPASSEAFHSFGYLEILPFEIVESNCTVCADWWTADWRVVPQPLVLSEVAANGMKSCGIVRVPTVPSWFSRVLWVINDWLEVLSLYALKGQFVTSGLICDCYIVKAHEYIDISVHSTYSQSN